MFPNRFYWGLEVLPATIKDLADFLGVSQMDIKARLKDRAGPESLATEHLAPLSLPQMQLEAEAQKFRRRAKQIMEETATDEGYPIDRVYQVGLAKTKQRKQTEVRMPRFDKTVPGNSGKDAKTDTQA